MSPSHPTLPPAADRPLLVLHPGEVTLAQLKAIHRGGVRVEFTADVRAGILAARKTVQDIVERKAVVYGINTGFGKLAQTIIPPERLAELQRNLVLSHSVGLGELIADDTVRLILVLKAISLARGHSGVVPGIVDALLALANAGVYPLSLIHI